MCIAVRLHHFCRHIFRKAEWGGAAFSAVGASPAAPRAIPCPTVWAGAVSIVGGDGFLNQQLLDLPIRETSRRCLLTSFRRASQVVAMSGRSSGGCHENASKCEPEKAHRISIANRVCPPLLNGSAVGKAVSIVEWQVPSWSERVVVEVRVRTCGARRRQRRSRDDSDIGGARFRWYRIHSSTVKM